MATRQDLIALVLENLGVLAAGQSASAEDREAVNRRIDPKLRELERREVFAGLNADSLDGAVFLYVGDIVAHACRTPFGITGAKADLLKAAAAEAEATLKGMARQFSAGASIAPYDIIRDVLERLGVVSPGQDPTEQDRGVVSARLAPMLADLRAQNSITVASLDEAPPAMLPHFAAILMASVAPAFGVAGPALAQLAEAASASEGHLRDLARQFDAGVGTSGTFTVAQAVLELLGVVEGGQTASAKDFSVISARYAPLLADLRARHIIDLPSVDGADASTKHHLAAILAARCALLFGVEEPALTGLRAEEARAEAALRAISRQLDTGIGTGATLDAPQSVLEILGVVAAGQSATDKDRAVVQTRMPAIFADLRDRQIITVTDFATAAASIQPHLIAVIAAAVAPLLGVEPDRLQALEADATRAESALRIISRQLDSGVATGGTFDLVQVTLENLGAVAVGRTATDKDRAIVSGRVTAVLDDLRTREVINLPSLAGAAPSTLLQLSVVLTSACAMAFGIPAEVRQALRAEAVQAEGELRRQARQLDTGTATSGTFDPIQSVLETLGVVTAGQTATMRDRAVVSARVAPMLADLAKREIIAVPSLAAADAATQIHLAAILALTCAVPFGIPAEPFQAPAAAAEAALRLLGRQFDGGVATSGAFDVVQAVLENLGVVAAGYTGSAKDRAVVSARVAPTLADLRLREIANIASLETADPGVLIHLSVILTAACAQAFGKSVETRAVLAADASRAETALRALARQLDTGTATSGAYDVVQATLEMLGVIEPGQTGSDRDRAVVFARVQPKLMELYGRDICGVTDLSQLTPELQGAFARCLAADCLLSFPAVPAPRTAMLLGMVPAAEQILRWQSFVYDARPPLRTERFWGHRHCRPNPSAY